MPIPSPTLAGLLVPALLAAADPPVRAATDGPPEIRVIRDLPYVLSPDADPERHRLDLYLPEVSERVPLLVWMHGGAWIVGDRAEEAPMARRFAEAGVAVAAIGYRLSPGVWRDPSLDQGITHPGHVRDCARAVAWLRAHAAEHGFDPARIFASGYSAGAHLAALIATDPRYLDEVGLSPGAIAGAIPVAGAYDLESYYEGHVEANGKSMADSHVLDVFGRGEGTLREASPVTYVAAAGTPMLVISETDTYDYTRRFEHLVEGTSRDDVRFHHVRDMNHAQLLGSMRFAADDDVRRRMVAFMRQSASPHAP